MAIKITFWRQGHANNSSSSHSLIFTRENLYDDIDGFEFNWENFTIASLQAKLDYFLVSAFNTTGRKIKFDSDNYEFTEKEARKDFVKNFLLSFAVSNLNIVTEPEYYEDKVLKGYIDHQSLVYFPTVRNPEEGIHWQFFRAWIEEIAKPEYVVLGGNDNSDGHPQIDLDLDNEGSHIKHVYRKLQYGSPICQYDEKTGEFVLSFARSGDLMKVKFE